MNIFLIFLGKLFSATLRKLNLGNGSTWPGHIALKMNKNFIQDIQNKSKTKIIVVAGTNGKTTTTSLIKTGLINQNYTVVHNTSGANLLNGIASTMLLHAHPTGKLKQQYAIFEVDENVLPLLLKQIKPDYLVIMNLFRDQLDRYGEIHSIARKWKLAFSALTDKTTLLLNADDPQIAYLGYKYNHALYFGVKAESTVPTQIAVDATFCPKCNTPLQFKQKTFSHLGDWYCQKCDLKRPKVTQQSFTYYPLQGLYNQYNIHAAALVLQQIGLSNNEIVHAFQQFKPAFGRQEIIIYKGKKVQLFLSKNPTSFNQSFETIKKLEAKTLLIVLNDRVPDGHDISWIWDIDFTGIKHFKHIFIAGDRAYDMKLRLAYEDCPKGETFRNLDLAIQTSIATVQPDETLFILPNYSAMLEIRKILTGKKIL